VQEAILALFGIFGKGGRGTDREPSAEGQALALRLRLLYDRLESRLQECSSALLEFLEKVAMYRSKA